MKTTLPVEVVAGFAQQTRELLSTYKTEMTAKGFDPTTMMTSLDTKGTALVGKNQEQEATKTALSTLTTETETIKGETLQIASGACDLVIAAYGRTSPQGKEATRLRKTATGPTQRRDNGGTTPPAPNP